MTVDDRLTDAEKVACYDTFRHIERVRNLLGGMVKEILDRCAAHDQSKLRPPEVGAFAAAKPLGPMTYGSKDYADNLADADLSKALAHHYANCRHHPQHHRLGVDGMNLIDVLEMFCDWKASSERHHDGNIRKSLETNAVRFNLSPQLVRILENTIDLLV